MRILFAMLIVFTVAQLFSGETKKVDETDYRKMLEVFGLKLRSFLDQEISGKVLGILPFDAKEVDHGVLMSDLYQYYLQNAAFSMVDRKELDKILAEIELEAEQITKMKNLYKLGSMSGADYLATGSLTNFKDKSFVNLKILEVATQKSIYLDSFNLGTLSIAASVLLIVLMVLSMYSESIDLLYISARR